MTISKDSLLHVNYEFEVLRLFWPDNVCGALEEKVWSLVFGLFSTARRSMAYSTPNHILSGYYHVFNNDRLHCKGIDLGNQGVYLVNAYSDRYVSLGRSITVFRRRCSKSRWLKEVWPRPWIMPT